MFLLFFLLSLLFSGPASTDDKGISFFSLDNGLQVYVIENHRFPVIAHILKYNVGHYDNPRGKTGLAHYLEHLMFGETKNIPDVYGALNRISGYYNAYTSHMVTVYDSVVYKNDISQIMQIDAERMRNTKFTDEALKNEKKIVIEENVLRNDAYKLELALLTSFFKNKIIDELVHEVESLNRSDTLRMYNRYYYPNNAVLFLAGDINVDEAKRLTKKYYENIKPGKIPKRVVPREPELTSDVFVHIKDQDARDSMIYMIYHSPSVIENKADFLLFDVFRHLLDLDLFSELYNKGMTVVSARVGEYYPLFDENVFSLSILTQDNITLCEISPFIDSVMESFIDNLSKEDLALVINKIKNEQNEDIYIYAHQRADQIIYGMNIDDLQSYDSCLEKVKLQDVKDIARKYLLNVHKGIGLLSRS